MFLQVLTRTDFFLNKDMRKKVFFYKVFFTDTDDSQDSRGREGTIFYSTLPLASAHEHWDIYLQLCMWDDYHVFLIATLVYQTATRWDLPPYRITIWMIDWWCNVCFFTWWIVGYLIYDLRLLWQTVQDSSVNYWNATVCVVLMAAPLRESTCKLKLSTHK